MYPGMKYGFSNSLLSNANNKRNYTELWATVRALAQDDYLYPRDYDVSQVTTALRKGEVIHADIFKKQTALKFKIVLEGGQSAIFKVMVM